MTRILTLLIGLFFYPFSYAGDGRDRLDAFVNELKSMQANFTQVLTDETGKVLEQSQGQVFLHRPGHFRWDYNTPYEQSIITDGERLWIYDVDLEQVSIRSMGQDMGGTPAALLGGNVNLDENFSISELDADDGLAWVSLAPKVEEGQYSSIHLGFSKAGLENMRMLDNFGQTTRIEFSGHKENQTIDPTIFEFVVPEGIDVLDSTTELQ